MTKSVSPILCDVDAEGSGNDEWVDKWFKPFDPRDEGTEANAEGERRSEGGNPSENGNARDFASPN